MIHKRIISLFSAGVAYDVLFTLLFFFSSCQPMKVTIAESALIRDVFCGHDGTMLLTDEGVIYACGSNAENKLALNHRHGFIAAMRNMFTRVWYFVNTRHFSGIQSMPKRYWVQALAE